MKRDEHKSLSWPQEDVVVVPLSAPWMDIARGEMERGVREIPGLHANPRILRYFTATGLRGTRAALSDETPWCSAFACWCLEQAGFAHPHSARARSWLDLDGAICAIRPRPGAIAVLWRGQRDDGRTGHVGFVREVFPGVTTHVDLLGGNQGNRVRLGIFPASRVITYLWPTKRLQAPAA